MDRIFRKKAPRAAAGTPISTASYPYLCSRQTRKNDDERQRHDQKPTRPPKQPAPRAKGPRSRKGARPRTTAGARTRSRSPAPTRTTGTASTERRSGPSSGRGNVTIPGAKRPTCPPSRCVTPNVSALARISLSTLLRRFACARLSQPCLPESCPGVSATLTTIAFDDSSLRWLETGT